MPPPMPHTPVAYYRRYGLQVKRCRDCFADVYLVRHVRTEKRCAIDAAPVKDGKVRIIGRQQRYEVTHAPADPELDPFRHTRHDCPRRRP